MSRFDPEPVLEFLLCRSPDAWVRQALADLDLLLRDHASLELKAAQQAQKLIWKYGAVQVQASQRLTPEFRSRLVFRMSRLAREELRHFEQVVALIEQRGGRFALESASRYAAGLHELIRRPEPDALVDTLIVGAIIEARSCERFLSLVEPLRQHDEALAGFYESLLRSEARHFEDYLELAGLLAPDELEDRKSTLLQRDSDLILQSDTALRFHSGPVETATQPR